MTLLWLYNALVWEKYTCTSKMLHYFYSYIHTVHMYTHHKPFLCQSSEGRALQTRQDYTRSHWLYASAHTHSLTMHTVLLEALPWCKVNISCHFAHFNITMYIAAFIHLILDFVSPAFIDTLGDPCWIVKCPALDTISLPDLLTCVTARYLICLSTITTVGVDGSN